MKTCKKCGIDKKLEDFVKVPNTKDGTISTCKSCMSLRRLSKRYEVTLTKKECYSCKLTKTAEEFPKNISLIGGLHTFCKKCSNKKTREGNYYKISGEIRKQRKASDSAYRIKINKEHNENRKKNITTQLLCSCKSRAFKKGIEFNITKKDIIIPEFCPILKVKLKCGTKEDYSNSPSIDRINNNLGYIKGNIQVISKKANTMKNNGTPEELILLASWINQTFKKE